jgi:hypothetical protein
MGKHPRYIIMDPRYVAEETRERATVYECIDGPLPRDTDRGHAGEPAPLLAERWGACVVWRPPDPEAFISIAANGEVIHVTDEWVMANVRSESWRRGLDEKTIRAWEEMAAERQRELQEMGLLEAPVALRRAKDGSLIAAREESEPR